MVLEDGDIFESGVALQVRNPHRVGLKNEFNFIVAELCERARVITRFHDDFVRSNGCHTVEDPIGATSGIAFDVVKRPEVRIRANLPLALQGQFEENLRLRTIAGTQRARTGPLFFPFRMTDDYPTASDWVLAQFH